MREGLLPCGVPSSPTHRCPCCKGCGRAFNIDARDDVGIPEQVPLGGSCVALWYPDGSVGHVQAWICSTCEGSGLRPRFGPDDVRAAEQWAARTGFRFPTLRRSQRRGMIRSVAGVCELDCVVGELGSVEGTRVHSELSTMPAQC